MPDPRPRNSVLLEPGTAQLAIRETYFEKHPDRFARLRVELVPEPGEVVPHPILSTDELASKLEFAAMFLTFVGGTAHADVARRRGQHEHVRRPGRLGARGGAGGRGALPLERGNDVPRGTLPARAGSGAGRDGARARQAVPLLGADADLTVDGELRLPLRHDGPEQQDGHTVGRRLLAHGDRAVAIRGWRTGSTPEAGSRATCWCAGSWPTVRPTRRPRWST